MAQSLIWLLPFTGNKSEYLAAGAETERKALKSRPRLSFLRCELKPGGPAPRD